MGRVNLQCLAKFLPGSFRIVAMNQDSADGEVRFRAVEVHFCPSSGLFQGLAGPTLLFEEPDG